MPSRHGTTGRQRVWLTAAAVALALVGPIEATSVADSEVSAAAEALFNEGRKLMKEGNYEAACAKFEASYTLEVSVGALLNLGECQRRRGALASSWSAFRRAAALAHRMDDRQRERFARIHADTLEPQLSYLTIEVPDEVVVRGLSVTINGQSVDQALWNQRVPRDPGEYIIRATAPSHEPLELRVEVPAKRGDVEATLAPLVQRADRLAPRDFAPAATRAEAPERSSVSRDTGSPALPLKRKIALASGAVGVAGVVAGSFYGLQARSRWNEARARCDSSGCTAEAVALGSQARGAAKISTAAFSIGIAATAAGALLWYLAPEHTSPRVAPILGADQAGMSVITRF